MLSGKTRVRVCMGWGGWGGWVGQLQDGSLQSREGAGMRTRQHLAWAWYQLRSVHSGRQQGQPAPLCAALPIYAVWGAGTGVGKTLASAGLAHAAHSLQVGLMASLG